MMLRRVCSQVLGWSLEVVTIERARTARRAMRQGRGVGIYHGLPCLPCVSLSLC